MKAARLLSRKRNQMLVMSTNRKSETSRVPVKERRSERDPATQP